MKIGVFDSGVGGKAVADAIKKALPEHEIILKQDEKHVPYGTRTPDEIYGFIKPIFEELIDEGCQVIVIACNTVTTTLIEKIRQNFDIPFVAVEPMVKPAAEMTKTGVIAVCATPATLNSNRYKWLKNEYAKHVKVLEPDCSDWALMIEENEIDKSKVADRTNEVLEQSADIIVLACTHYHWIENQIKALSSNKAHVIQPEQPLIEQLKRVIEQL